MSNVVTIILMKFLPNIKGSTEATYGYVANDDYRQVYDDTFLSFEDVYRRYKTEVELVLAVLNSMGEPILQASLTKIDDTTYENSYIGIIHIVGYNNTP